MGRAHSFTVVPGCTIMWTEPIVLVPGCTLMWPEPVVLVPWPTIMWTEPIVLVPGLPAVLDPENTNYFTTAPSIMLVTVLKVLNRTVQ